MKFKIEDRVFLKITALQGSVMVEKEKKFKPRYVEPFKILQRVGKVAYRLKLPISLSRIHDIFQVSLLKKYYPDPTHVL